ncbi:MAG: TolC family protein [Pseudomonadota bacterium]
MANTENCTRAWGAHWKGSVAAVAVTAVLLGGCVRPTALDQAALADRVSHDLEHMYADQEPVHGSINLYEAMARGLKYNLDKRLKTMERHLSVARLRHVSVDMLPQAAARAGWRVRDPVRGSSSRSLITGNQSLEVSTSEDKRIRYADLHMVWNLLDFGLSYLRAKQEADQVLIAEERRVKVVQNLIMDIRTAYWRAVAAQKLLPRIGRLIHQIEHAIARSRRVAKSGAGEPADELRLQRKLLAHKRDLVEVRRKLSVARGELAALMNVKPGTKFRLHTGGHHGFHVPHLKGRVADIEFAALLSRPELREEHLKRRISRTEVRAAYVRLLPGVELRSGKNYDSNSFLLSSDWSDAGVLITKNLVELATAPIAIDYAKKGVKVADARRRALSMAVIAQIHIALHRFAMAKDTFKVSRRLYRVDYRLSRIAREGEANQDTSGAEALAARSQAMVSALHYYTAYADVQNAYGRILNSVGTQRVPESLERLSVKALSKRLHGLLKSYHRPTKSWKLASR